MKKIYIFFTIIILAVPLTSCTDCFLLAILGRLGVVPLGAGLACLGDLEEVGTSVDNAMHGDEPASSSTNEGNQPEEETGFALRDILSSPTFTLGPSLSWLGGDKEESEKFPARPGFQLGAIWQVPLTAGLNLEPGLLYGNRGVGYKSEESGYYEPGVPGGSYGYSYGQKKKLHYLELPVFVSGSIMNGLDLYGGPQVAFLLGAKVVNESNGETTSTEKGTKGLNKVDLGLAAGARYQIPNTFFSVSLGYYHGLSNLSSGSEYGGGYDEPKYFTRAARLGINYNFPAARTHATSGSAKKNGFKSWVAK